MEGQTGHTQRATTTTRGHVHLSVANSPEEPTPPPPPLLPPVAEFRTQRPTSQCVCHWPWLWVETLTIPLCCHLAVLFLVNISPPPHPPPQTLSPGQSGHDCGWKHSPSHYAVTPRCCFWWTCPTLGQIGHGCGWKQSPSHYAVTLLCSFW